MIGLIWAQSRNGVIGANGSIPWSLPEDLAHFRRVTFGATVVMGRRTWQSLPAPLAGRTVIVVSSTLPMSPGVRRADSVPVALSMAVGDVWVAGGAELYRAAMPRADRLLVTEVDVDVPGDTWAPDIGPEWSVTTEGHRPLQITTDSWLTSRTGLRYRIRSYGRT